MKLLTVAAIVAGLVLTPAIARHHHRHHQNRQHTVQPICVPSFFQQCGQPTFAHRFKEAVKRPIRAARHVIEVASTYLPHPDGCPRTAFCGCGAAKEIGRGDDRSLWLAANWFRFPRAQPGHNMAAVRRHHVFIIKKPIDPQQGVWLAADYNSGKHLSRLHPRSIRGFTIVNPG